MNYITSSANMPSIGLRATAVVLLGCALLANPLHAQDGPVYVGGSFLVSSSSPDWEPGEAGYLRPSFHGLLDWPVAGLGVNGGAFVARHWDIRGELSLRRAATGHITEDEQTGHSEWHHLFSRYESSERVLFVAAGRRIRAGSKVDLHPVGGFNVSFATQRLADRHGTYTYGVTTVPVDEPDVLVSTTNYGFGGGADVVIGTESPVAFVGGVRLLWFHRPLTPVYERTVPPLGSSVLNVTAGIRWRARRTRPPRTT